jgi:hypothetical protein
MAGDEDQACLAAAAAQGARDIGGGGDRQRWMGDRIGRQHADVAHAALGELAAHRLDAVVEGGAVVVAGDQHRSPAIGRHRAADRRIGRTGQCRRRPGRFGCAGGKQKGEGKDLKAQRLLLLPVSLQVYRIWRLPDRSRSRRARFIICDSPALHCGLAPTARNAMSA